MTRTKTENLEVSGLPLALIVGESEITASLSQKLSSGGCEVVELQNFPKSGKFNYIFQFGGVANVKDSHLKFLKPGGKYVFVDFKNENIETISGLPGIKILRIDNISPWYYQKITDSILKITFTDTSKNVIDLRLKDKADGKIVESRIIAEGNLAANVSGKLEQIKISTGIVQKNLSLPLKILFTFLILFLVSVVSFSYLLFSQIKSDLQAANEHFQSQDLNLLQSDLNRLNSKFRFAKNTVSVLEKTPLKNFPPVAKMNELLTASDNFLLSLNLTVNLLGNLNEKNNAFVVKDFLLTENKFNEFTGSLVNLSGSAKNLKSKLENIDIPYFSTSQMTAFLDSAISDLDSVTSIMPPFREMLYSGKKNYLLLFQNNMELRATGGFIGSVGFLTIDNGNLNNLEIMDVYTLDGQLKGHIDPPVEIRKYLNQPNFFLRDSNFDPDFAVSAQNAQFFLDKSLNRKVDGVIGINLFLLQDLLETIGPVTLTDFNNEVITSDNLFIKAQVFINQNFFPGSNQKRDFLSALALELEKKMVSKDVSLIKVFKVIKTSLEQKNLLFNFNDQKLQKEFEELGWAGRIPVISCYNAQNNCLPDYLAVIESNFGVNKANYFVSKSVQINKQFTALNQINTDLILNYHNQSQSGLLQGGDYANYLRLYLPKGSNFTSADLNGNKLTLKDFDVSSYRDDKVVFGMLIKIPQNSDSVFKFSYQLPKSFSDVNLYQFYVQKQAGDKSENINLNFNPGQLKIEPYNFHGATDSNNSLSVDSDSSIDRIFQLKLLH